MTLFETYNQILNEAVAQSKIINAIKNRLIVKFYYDGDQAEKKGWRTGEIYAFGESSQSNLVIRMYQTEGNTSSSIPNWKMFLIDKIRDIEYVGEFDQARPGFNRSGDKSMQTVHHLVKF